MLKYRKIAPIGFNQTGYDVLVDGQVIGQVYGYVGQSATREYREWTAVVDGREITARRKPATRWQAVELMVEARAKEED